MVDDASRPAASAMTAPSSPTPTTTAEPTSTARASVSPTPAQRPTVLASGSGMPESLALGALEQGLPPLEESLQLLACAPVGDEQLDVAPVIRQLAFQLCDRTLALGDLRLDALELGCLLGLRWSLADLHGLLVAGRGELGSGGPRRGNLPVPPDPLPWSALRADGPLRGLPLRGRSTAHVLRPAAVVGVQPPVLDCQGALCHCVEERAVV